MTIFPEVIETSLDSFFLNASTAEERDELHTLLGDFEELTAETLGEVEITSYLVCAFMTMYLRNKEEVSPHVSNIRTLIKNEMFHSGQLF
ncbi:hypothetical protein [Moorena sp. SIO3A2]|uniref:hypothetical protein n=1 Tax=Moorena sp. SIO3A2 TaxID=2607841 RepID=UPI0013B85DA3|nr:hypothetical protein [Moorena sp. SIO3A2]NER90319.1 hypothetical protein [Moorena sp. SIO3A2]